MATVLSQRTFAAGTPWRVSASSIVVVIQGRHVNELEGHGGGDQPRVRRIAEVPRQEREHRAEPLPAGREEVVRGGGQQLRVGLSERLVERLLHAVETRPDLRLQDGVGRLQTGDRTPAHGRRVRRAPISDGSGTGASLAVRPLVNRFTSSLPRRPGTVRPAGPMSSVTGLSRGMEPQAEPGRLKGRNVGPEQAEGGSDGSNQTCSFARRDPAGVVRGPAGRRDIGSLVPRLSCAAPRPMSSPWRSRARHDGDGMDGGRRLRPGLLRCRDPRRPPRWDRPRWTSSSSTHPDR